MLIVSHATASSLMTAPDRHLLAVLFLWCRSTSELLLVVLAYVSRGPAMMAPAMRRWPQRVIVNARDPL